MRNRTRVSILVAILATVACLAVVAVALANAHGRTRRHHVNRSPVAHAAALQGLAQLAPDVAALRASHSPNDAVSDRLVHSALLSDGVADAGLARRVGFSKPVWFLPGADGQSMCVLTPASLNCPLSKDVEDHGFAPSMSWTAQGPVRVTGIASDAVARVEIVQADGAVNAVDVTNNLLDYASERAPREVRWTGPDGPHTFVLPSIKGR